jgi:hypothetical protein
MSTFGRGAIANGKGLSLIHSFSQVLWREKKDVAVITDNEVGIVDDDDQVLADDDAVADGYTVVVDGEEQAGDDVVKEGQDDNMDDDDLGCEDVTYHLDLTTPFNTNGHARLSLPRR